MPFPAFLPVFTRSCRCPCTRGRKMTPPVEWRRIQSGLTQPPGACASSICLQGYAVASPAGVRSGAEWSEVFGETDERGVHVLVDLKRGLESSEDHWTTPGEGASDCCCKNFSKKTVAASGTCSAVVLARPRLLSLNLFLPFRMNALCAVRKWFWKNGRW